jgi:hypothetical protein
MSKKKRQRGIPIIEEEDLTEEQLAAAYRPPILFVRVLKSEFERLQAQAGTTRRAAARRASRRRKAHRDLPSR